MDIAELIKRVEGLTGADREVDAAVLKAMGYTYDRFGRSWWDRNVPIENDKLTASVDAVIQLIGEKMPVEWEIRGSKDESVAYLYAESVASGGNAPTPALALLIAFLRAWEARGEKA